MHPLPTPAIDPPLRRAMSVSGSVRIDTRACLAFAAVTGYRDERFTDDARADGLEAAPGFVSCLEWHVHGPARHLRPLAVTDAERARTLHAWVDTRLVRPIRPGTVVRVLGHPVRLSAVARGLEVVMRYRTIDADGGALLAVTDTCAVLRDVTRPGIAAAGAAPRPAGLSSAGDASGEGERIAFDPMFAHLYSECTGIWNPVHTERRAAIAAGLAGPIIHGTGLWCVITRSLVQARPGGSPGRVRRMGARFRRPVPSGAVLTLRHRRVRGGTTYVAGLEDGSVALEGYLRW